LDARFLLGGTNQNLASIPHHDDRELRGGSLTPAAWARPTAHHWAMKIEGTVRMLKPIRERDQI
jgi:hypothetical protein